MKIPDRKKMVGRVMKAVGFPVLNPFVNALLKSPLHGLMSKEIMPITYTGRRSGRSYTTPVSYVRDGQRVRCFTGTNTPWWWNFRGGASVSLRIRGEDFRGRAEAVTGDEEPKRVADAFESHLNQRPRDAAYHDVSLDSNKKPDPAELARRVPSVVLVEIALD